MFEGDPIILVPQIFSNFIFPLYVYTLKFHWSSFLDKKRLNFGGPVWGDPPIVALPFSGGHQCVWISIIAQGIFHVRFVVQK